GSCEFNADAAVVTVPLGVLKASGDGSIRFIPELTEKAEAIRNLEMGEVMKVTLEFKERFWPVENFGFVHSDDSWLPTWWADDRGWILTGWAGGPRAQALSTQGRDAIIEHAIASLA